MAYFEGVVVSENQRWAGKRKAETVLDIIKGKVTLVDFCRANDLKQTDVERWMDDFVKSGTQGLKSNAKDRLSEQDRQIAELQQVIGEQALRIRVLIKSIELAERCPFAFQLTHPSVESDPPGARRRRPLPPLTQTCPARQSRS